MDTQFSEAKNHSYYINMGIKTLMEVNFSKVQTYIFYTRTKSNKHRPYQCVKCRYILEYTIINTWYRDGQFGCDHQTITWRSVTKQGYDSLVHCSKVQDKIVVHLQYCQTTNHSRSQYKDFVPSRTESVFITDLGISETN